MKIMNLMEFLSDQNRLPNAYIFIRGASFFPNCFLTAKKKVPGYNPSTGIIFVYDHTMNCSYAGITQIRFLGPKCLHFVSAG